jgi:hypothetical protein
MKGGTRCYELNGKEARIEMAGEGSAEELSRAILCKSEFVGLGVSVAHLRVLHIELEFDTAWRRWDIL